MSETIGDMIDKLTISNIRLWNLEDTRREYTNGKVEMSSEELKTFLGKVSSTNRERNDLIDQINAGMTVLIDKIQNKDSSYVVSANELLGTRKNKFYKEEDK